MKGSYIEAEPCARLTETLMAPLGHDICHRDRWMTYGRLIDPENEFFIQRCDGRPQSEGSHGEVRLPSVVRAQ